MNIVTVKWGDKYSPDYVNILYDAVKRYSDKDLKLICFTDNPEGIDEHIETRKLPGNLRGWWNKLYLFSSEAGLKGRTFFLDLDTIIFGDIDPYLELDKPFLILRDFYRPAGYGSGLMSWEGDYSYIWEEFKQAGYPELDGGDQVWMERYELECFQDHVEGICSYKQNDCERWPPRGTKIVCFHGIPNPHEIKGSWVEDAWKKGGMGEVKIDKKAMNVPVSVAVGQMRENCKRDLPWLLERPEKNKTLCIVGGAPSLRKNMGELKKLIRLGADVMSLNGATRYIHERGVKPDYHVQFDAREENIEFLPDIDGVYLIGSMSHPGVFDALEGKNVVVWHALLSEDVFEEQSEIMENAARPGVMIGGGATVGLRALYLGFFLGYRKLVLFGMDSSYSEEDHHAYKQSLNDRDGRMEVWANRGKYICAPWMLRQAQEFQGQYRTLVLERGCSIRAIGEGLLPDICRIMNWQVMEINNAKHVSNQ